jgi:hypothetical protein
MVVQFVAFLGAYHHPGVRPIRSTGRIEPT